MQLTVGTDAAQILAQAHALYKRKHKDGKAFKFEHCWENLKNVPKFVVLSEPQNIRTPSNTPSKTPDKRSTEVFESPSIDRPQGNKAAKREHQDDASKSMGRIAKAAEEKVAVMAAQLLLEKEKLRVLGIPDDSGVS